MDLKNLNTFPYYWWGASENSSLFEEFFHLLLAILTLRHAASYNSAEPHSYQSRRFRIRSFSLSMSPISLPFDNQLSKLVLFISHNVTNGHFTRHVFLYRFQYGIYIGTSIVNLCITRSLFPYLRFHTDIDST